MLRTMFALIALVAPAIYAQPGDPLRDTYNALKAAEEKNDVQQVKKLSVQAGALAQKVIDAAHPGDQADEASKANVETARDILKFSNYALFAVALRSTDNATVIDLFETLETKSPDSEYVPQLRGRYVAALLAAGQGEKAFTVSEKGLAKNPSDEDLLLVAANGCLTRKSYERAAGYAVRLARVMETHPRPEGMTAAAWEQKRTEMLGRGYWIAGVAYASANKYTYADEDLRKALPLVKDNPQMAAGALFYLGLANYNLARATHDRKRLSEALKFSEGAAAVAGPYQASASQNASAIRRDLRTFR
jgi:tetratricopeptide (TPR) repeat protein